MKNKNQAHLKLQKLGLKERILHFCYPIALLQFSKFVFVRYLLFVRRFPIEARALGLLLFLPNGSCLPAKLKPTSQSKRRAFSFWLTPASASVRPSASNASRGRVCRR